MACLSAFRNLGSSLTPGARCQLPATVVEKPHWLARCSISMVQPRAVLAISIHALLSRRYPLTAALVADEFIGVFLDERRDPSVLLLECAPFPE